MRVLPGHCQHEMIDALSAIIDQIFSLQEKIDELNRCIKQQHRASDVAKRLEGIPGIGIITATAMAATVTDPAQFKTGRDLAAWIGLVPKQHSTGGKARLGGISKQGDRYLRRLLVGGGTSVVKLAKIFPWRYPWVAKLLEKKPAKVVAVVGRQQTGAGRLGGDELRWHLSTSGASGTSLAGLGKGWLRHRWREFSSCEGDDDVM